MTPCLRCDFADVLHFENILWLGGIGWFGNRRRRLNLVAPITVVPKVIHV